MHVGDHCDFDALISYHIYETINFTYLPCISISMDSIYQRTPLLLACHLAYDINVSLRTTYKRQHVSSASGGLSDSKAF
jgi:hypothetical protein